MKKKIQLALPLLVALLTSLLVCVLPASAGARVSDEKVGDEKVDDEKVDDEKAATEEAASAEQAESEDEPFTNTIRWTTASEVDNFGFDVYRSESEEGPFEVLTEQPLEGGGTVDEPRDYVFVDDTIDPTKAYYYYVESIAMSGARERFTPVVKAKAKKPSPDGEDDAEQ